MKEQEQSSRKARWKIITRVNFMYQMESVTMEQGKSGRKDRDRYNRKEIRGGAQEVGGVDGPGKKPDRKFKQAGRSKKKKLDVPVDQPLICTFLPVENADAGEEDPPDQMDEFFAGQEFEF